MQLDVLAGAVFAEEVVVREPVLRPHLLKNWASTPSMASHERIS